MKKTLFLLSVLSLSAVANTVQHEINIDRATNHEAAVTSVFPADDATQLIVKMPNWRTGKYQILNLASGVRDFSAKGDDGRTLTFKKIDKGSWAIDKKAGESVTVRYDIYGNELGGRVRHIDDSHAFLDASGVWMYSDNTRALPLTVKLTVPSGWQSRSGMSHCGDHCFTAANYDVLIDSPIETGIHEFQSFEADGKQYELAIWGRGNHDSTQIIADLKKMVTTVGKLYGYYPFDRYLFIVHATNGEGGATEHLNSTVIQKSRWGFAPRKDYLDFFRTATHEFVHTWNVKDYRPKEMVPYDYQKENHTTLLWIAEGSTSYFDELHTLKAGVQKRDEYLEQIAKQINDYQHTPGNLRMSASDASFDEWIHGTTDKERARNANSGIYTKGELLGLLFDLKLRAQTQGKKGWQDVHNVLAQQHRVAQGGFGEAEVLAALQKVGGRSFDTEWRDYVQGTKAFPFEELLLTVGMRFEIDVAKDADVKTERWAGINIKEDNDAQRLPLISDVEANTPAWKAGLVAGDIIVAVDNLRVSGKDFSDRVSALKQDKVLIKFFRRDELRETTVELVSRAKGKAKLKAIDNPSKQQKALNEAWLGVPWPEKK